MVLGLALGATPAWAFGVDQTSRSWHFTARLDGKRISEHDFVVTRQGDEVVIDSDAHWKVTFAFNTACVYEHHNHEVRRNGCLTQICSQTNDNGNPVFVHGPLQVGGFEIHTSHGATTLPACVRTFVYKDRSLLGDSKAFECTERRVSGGGPDANGRQSLCTSGQQARHRAVVLGRRRLDGAAVHTEKRPNAAL